MAKGEKEKQPEPSDLIGGVLNVFGLKIDLKELLASPENLKGRLEELRDSLKEAGGKEILSDEEWRRGGAGITGHIRTRGVLGEQEFHVGTTGRPGRKRPGRPAPEPPEPVEPPVDVFDEGEQVVIVADLPGAGLEDIEVTIEGRVLSLSTKKTARRMYRKELRLEADVAQDSLQPECRNGVLEVRLQKRKAAEG